MKDSEKIITKKEKTILSVVFWAFVLIPLIMVMWIYLSPSDEDLPAVSLLDNPPELLASEIIATNANGKDTIIGKYWKVNRTSIKYREISPYVIDALISTEDERFHSHSGIDFRALIRAAKALGSDGGGSTISQQLAKQLFTMQERMDGTGGDEKLEGAIGTIFIKAKEHIIATRLEKRYTKKEIITMYLNQFDFLYNAVGIENASRVYFNKSAIDLTKGEAAMLVGMCKNPGLYNPYSFKRKNYTQKILIKKGISISELDLNDVKAARSKDSIRAIQRRNQVLFQWLRNSENNNPSIQNKLSRQEYNKLKTMPIVVHYTSVDHKAGIAPYFRESLRAEVVKLLNTKTSSGAFKYAKKDGSNYNIYRDGLKIYTTINTGLQEKAEEAVMQHLSGVDPSGKNKKKIISLQNEFDKNNKRYSSKRWPFSNSVSEKTVNSILSRARRNSDRYDSLKAHGYSASEIEKSFNIPVPMKVFSWRGEVDTILTPNDSIKYYRSFLHAGLVSIDPRTGFVKAWVGGAQFKHFSYDHVRTGKRQVGSTIKPFIYATALSMKTVKPCTKFSEEEHCVEIVDDKNQLIKKYSPRGTAAKTVSLGISQSSNPTTVAVMGSMGRYNSFKETGGPYQVDKLLRKMNIRLRYEDLVPAMCLGTPDLNLFELVSGQCVFVNNGIYIKPTTIERITDKHGRVIYSANQESDRVLSSTVSYEILKMMKGVVQGGTGSSLRASYRPWGGITVPTAGKTGTTQNNADGWFMGLTPELVTGVWVGAEDPTVRFRTMTWGQGARMALPIYGYYMQKVYADERISPGKGDFEVPFDYNPEEFKCEEELTIDNNDWGEF